jgi:hypothetical protein
MRANLSASACWSMRACRSACRCCSTSWAPDAVIDLSVLTREGVQHGLPPLGFLLDEKSFQGSDHSGAWGYESNGYSSFRAAGRVRGAVRCLDGLRLGAPASHEGGPTA